MARILILVQHEEVDDSGYTDRYRLTFAPMLYDHIFDAARVIASERGQGIHGEPIHELSTLRDEDS